MPPDMFCFNAFLIYHITSEIKRKVHLKKIARLAEAAAQIVNEWNNPFFCLYICGLLHAENYWLGNKFDFHSQWYQQLYKFFSIACNKSLQVIRLS